jgi:hypothetical protein
MSLRRAGLAAGLLAAWGYAAASAQTMSYKDAGALIAKSCGRDIVRHCPTVNMGGGALKACLARVEAKLSAQCVEDYKMAQASLEKRAAAQAAVPGLCELDARRYCKGVKPGDGHYLTCLNTASKVVSANCQQALADAGWN